jgi:hypothetical protein
MPESRDSSGFDEDGSGEFQFGCVHSDLPYQDTKRKERPAVVFTFEGNNETDPRSGRVGPFGRGTGLTARSSSTARRFEV